MPPGCFAEPAFVDLRHFWLVHPAMAAMDSLSRLPAAIEQQPQCRASAFGQQYIVGAAGSGVLMSSNPIPLRISGARIAGSGNTWVRRCENHDLRLRVRNRFEVDGVWLGAVLAPSRSTAGRVARSDWR